MIDNKRRSLYTPEYYRNLDLYYETKNKVIKRILKRLYGRNFKGSSTIVLDIGCGRGELVYSLSKNCSRVYGLDYSENALLFSKTVVSRIPEDIKKKTFLLCADACFLPFKNNSIEHIFSLDVFEHLNDYELKILVKEICRVLKKGGHFTVYTYPNKEYLEIGYRYWVRPVNIIFNPISKLIFKKELMIVSPNNSDPTHVNLLSVKSLRRIFLGKNFEVRIYTRWFLPSNFIGYIYKIISQLWPITLFYPLRNFFCPFLWAEGEKIDKINYS